MKNSPKASTKSFDPVVRRWQDGRVIGHTALGETFQDDFEVPYYVVHRAHFHDALYQTALQLGVVVDLNCTVAEYDLKDGSVTLVDGTSVQGDIVVAADGKLLDIFGWPLVHFVPQFTR